MDYVCYLKRDHVFSIPCGFPLSWVVLLLFFKNPFLSKATEESRASLQPSSWEPSKLLLLYRELCIIDRSESSTCKKSVHAGNVWATLSPVDVCLEGHIVKKGSHCISSSTYNRGKNGDAIEANTGNKGVGITSGLCSSTNLLSIQQTPVCLKIINKFRHGCRRGQLHIHIYTRVSI